MKEIGINDITQAVSNTKRYSKVLGLFIAGYFLTAFFSKADPILTASMRESFNLSNAPMSILISVYCVSFGLFQIPLGILLDRFGSYWTQATLFMTAFLGMIICEYPIGYPLLILSQIFIGIGFSGGLVTGLKIIIETVPKSQLSIYISLFMAIGILGGGLGTVSLKYLLSSYSWQPIILSLAGLTLAIALLIYKNRETPNSSLHLTLSDHIHSAGYIIKSQVFMKLAPLTSLCFGINISMLSLGRVKCIGQHDIFATTLSLIAGIMSSGYIINYINIQYKVDMFFILISGIILFVACQCFLSPQIIFCSPIKWIIFGFTARLITISYAILAKSFHNIHLGKCLTLLNFTNISTAFFTGVFINKSVYYLQTGFALSATASLRMILIIMAIFELIALLWLLNSKQFFTLKKEIKL